MEKPSFTPTWRAAVDMGVAFTSACACVEDSGETFNVKVPSTPGDPASGVRDALIGLCEKSGLSPEKISMVILGSTFLYHAIASGHGAKTALLVTMGFRDILYTGGRYLLRPYDLWERKAFPPVSRSLTFEINERILPGGRVVTPISDDEIINLIPVLKKAGIESVAVCFLHSYETPLHEQRVKDILNRQMPGIPVTVSSDVLPVAGEFERAYAAAENAILRPLMAGCLTGLKSHLTGPGKKVPGIFALQSDGSATISSRIPEESARAILSGPMGGVLACVNIAKATGRSNLITLDVGATGARLSVITRNLPGSLGPETLKGYSREFNIQEILSVPLGAESAVQTCGDSLKIHKSFNGILTGAIKLISVRKGYDPREFTLVAFGGAGPLHAAGLALRLGIPRVLVPPHPGTFSARGMLYADLRREYKADLNSLLAYTDPELINSEFCRLEDSARRELSGEGVNPDRIAMIRSADIRYRGYSYEINMQFPSGKLKQADLLLLSRAFKLNHQSEFGLPPDGVDAEIANLRLAAVIKLFPAVGDIPPTTPDLRSKRGGVSPFIRWGHSCPQKDTQASAGVSPFLNKIIPAGRKEAAHAEPVGTRKIFFDDISVDAPVYQRIDLKPFTDITGPAVVDQDDTSTVIWPGMSASTDALGNIVIDVGVK